MPPPVSSLDPLNPKPPTSKVMEAEIHRYRHTHTYLEQFLPASCLVLICHGHLVIVHVHEVLAHRLPHVPLTVLRVQMHRQLVLVLQRIVAACIGKAIRLPWELSYDKQPVVM